MWPRLRILSLREPVTKSATKLEAKSETGSATITALIVVGVAAVLITGLMWRQQVQIRSLENARDRVQAQWLQRTAIDFGRLVLVEDQRTSQYDHLGEAWALPLADGKVADFLKNTDIPDEIATVTFNGQLSDAQGLFNLTNLWDRNFQAVNSAGVQEFGRLLDALGLDRELAQQTAQAALQSDMPINDVDGLLRLPNYNLAILQQLRPFVVVLPNLTTVNVNTASPEVLMASINGLSRGAANSFVQQRAMAPLKTLDEVTSLINKVGSGAGLAIDPALVDVKSQYWVGRTEIHLGRGIFVSSALIQRSPTPLPNGNLTQVIWSKTGKMAAD
ncbi:type II secretion system minor pseudopilin GspK [Polynucleobacter sp. Fuers-14]|uniref:type II secretion system minor pseudopilin GspK n=1 Tax=Polynucleobacter sp. Fuers-14 TaxID=1758364 RepID=UPI001C0DB351|nr:type II secretion system minor pseudopilin GspK [Polynucleobacter sp. Fuers-14]MBU3641345.1 type II secretion system minor pseudopilin GspK [Polynucleobacter sp. Fuers-14]